MTEDFIEYEESVDLKNMSFNIPCIKGFYDKEVLYTKVDSPVDFNGKRQLGELVSCPTYAQAFRWFNDVHKLHAEPFVFFNEKNEARYNYRIMNLRNRTIDYCKSSDSKEPPRRICLKQMISMCTFLTIN
jgi:hypothetical protein